MTIINKSAIVPFSAQKMFDLVDDVDSYAEFLPWCSSTESKNRTETSVDGTLFVTKGKIKLSFSTHNEMKPGQEIKLRLLSGPFKRLTGLWTFRPLKENACKVTLRMEFEFSNKVLSLALGFVFSQIANSMLDSFCKRAKNIYTKDGSSRAV
jgi:ribosome-associated toxin RatA of RatAB toxin-antitoxin module